MRGAATFTCLALVTALTGCQKIDPLFCGKNPNDSRCGGDGGLTGDGGGVTIGGTVTGLAGAGGLVLENNAGDDKPIASDGAFRFPTPIDVGAGYLVTVNQQPTNPSEVCTVANGGGTASGDVSDVAVTCAVASYKLGGIVVGLSSGTVTLTNGTDSVTVPNGTFKFSMPVASGMNYSVATSGATTCQVGGGTGTMGTADVSTVVVNCAAGTFTIGGMVSGLTGTVKLKNEGADEISVSANGSFAFPTTQIGNTPFAVTVSQQPAYPPASQNCVVTGGSGNVTGNVVTVVVTCTTNSFHVKGNASGVNGTVVLRDNGADDLTLNASGAFMFATPIQSGHTYMVTVFQQPAALACSVSNANGTIANGDATNVAVMCAYRDQGIACGGSYCTAGTQECCDPEGGSTCQARSANCNQLSLSCDSAADCGGGDDCCASEDHGNVLSVSCQNGCGFKTSTLCDPMASNPCPSGGSCKPYSLLSGYYSCQ